jgi:pyroglutamyl-peptidase
MMEGEDGRCSKSVAFIVTGFGPFGNSGENPTTVICNHLMKHLNGTLLACRTTTRVIETSAQAARAELDAMDLSDLAATTVILHLGVNYRGTQFHLEQCAYNDATFRMPDEQGYHPRNVSIVPERPFNTCLKTLLNINAICSNMNHLVVSTDPGRFVCNYTYFYSLNKTQTLHRVHSLFLHVPPFSVIPEEEQLSVVVKLMQCIDQQLVNAS